MAHAQNKLFSDFDLGLSFYTAALRNCLKTLKTHVTIWPPLQTLHVGHSVHSMWTACQVLPMYFPPYCVGVPQYISPIIISPYWKNVIQHSASTIMPPGL